MNAPKLAIGDGAMGFWAALDEVYPTTRHQRCWQHKTMNVLNCLPKLSQPKAKAAIHNIWQAETKDDADKAFDLFLKIYKPKYPKAALCLQKDREELMAFFDFPAQHWQSIRTSNPIESAFATIRHRTKRSKGCLSRDGMLHIPLVTFLQNALPGSGCSSWANAPNKTGESYAALTTSPKSSQALRSKTELKPNPTRSPHDQQASNTRFDNNSFQRATLFSRYLQPHRALTEHHGHHAPCLDRHRSFPQKEPVLDDQAVSV
jgi:hypothetical protein